MREIFTDSIGHIKLGSTLLPGIFDSMEIEGELRIDEKDIPGTSKKAKQPMGFEDAKIRLKIILLTDENTNCYKKLETLIKLFQATDKHAKPYVYRIVNHLTDTCKIKKVLYKSYSVFDTKGRDSLEVNLNFEEYTPVLVKVEKKAQKKKNGDKSKSGFDDDKNSSKSSTNTKTKTTPAEDDDKTAWGLIKDGAGGVWDWVIGK